MHQTQSCLMEIESLSNETSSEKRRDVLHKVTDLFFMTTEQQTSDDIATFGNVMEHIAYELEVEARAELSERISEIDKAPRRLVCRLATDDIEVARPVLERSTVLTDDDLVQIAKTRGQTHLHAIAKRPTLAAPVTDVIVERGESPVLQEVTKNKGAKFSQDGLGILAQKARTDGKLLTALGSRGDLPPDLMHEIKQRVAQKIKTEMAGKYDANDMANLDALVDESADNLDIDEFKKTNDEMNDLAKKHQLTEDDIVNLARTRKLSETVRALSLVTGLDDRMVSHCLLKAEIAALGIICKANGFKSTTYLTLIQTRVGGEGIASRDVARAMREYDVLSESNAKRTLRFLKVRASVKLDEGQVPAQGQGQIPVQGQVSGQVQAQDQLQVQIQGHAPENLWQAHSNVQQDLAKD
jgi:uncharacterized protein (DUF2336 family)